MPDFQEAEPLLWKSDDEPDLVVFVSHRWRSSHHPDPDGQTLRGLTCLLEAVQQLAAGLDPINPTAVPSLREPGMLHACVLLQRLWEQAEDMDGAGVLGRIALFFDFSCLPQGETPEHQQQLKNGLASFPQMIPDPRVLLLALRQQGDDYGTRSWCVAESVLSLTYDELRPWAQTFPLRMALRPEANVVQFTPLDEAIENWDLQVAGQVQITAQMFHQWIDLVQLCVDWHGQAQDEARELLHHSPGIAEQSFQLWLTVTLQLAECGYGTVDLVPVLQTALVSVGLGCTDPDDAVPTALLIMAGLRWEELNRNSGTPCQSISVGNDFWQQCFARYLVGGLLQAHVELLPPSKPGYLTSPKLTLLSG